MRKAFIYRSLVIMFCLSAQIVRAEEALSAAEREKALELLKSVNRLHTRNELAAMGGKVLPVLWVECQKPIVTDDELAWIFAVVAKIPGDREQFVELVAKHLQKKRIPTFGFFSALYLIKVTKSSKYAPDVAKRLCASDILSINVAETLVAIGTEKELLALEAWMKKDGRPDSDIIKKLMREKIEGLRDRLAKEKKSD